MFEGYEQYLPEILQAAAQIGGVDPKLWQSMVVRGEQSTHDQVSPKGAFGRAQLMPATAQEVNNNYFGGKLDPKKFIENIILGAAYAGQQDRRYGGNPDLIAAAYNAGPGVADKLKKTGNPDVLPDETKKYTANVRRGMQMAQFQQQPHASDVITNAISQALGTQPSTYPDNTGQFFSNAQDAASAYPGVWSTILKSLLTYNPISEGVMSRAAEATAPKPQQQYQPPTDSPIVRGMYGIPQNINDVVQQQPASQALQNDANDIVKSILSQAGAMVPRTPRISPQQIPVPESPTRIDNRQAYDYLQSGENKMTQLPPVPQMDETPHVWEDIMRIVGAGIGGPGGDALTTAANARANRRETKYKNDLARYNDAVERGKLAGTFDVRRSGVAEDEAKYNAMLDRERVNSQRSVDMFNASQRASADTQNAAADRARNDDVYNIGSLIGSQVAAGRRSEDQKGKYGNKLLESQKFNIGGTDITGEEAMARGSDFYIAAKVLDDQRKGIPTQARVGRYVRGADQIAKSVLSARGNIKDNDAVGAVMDGIKQLSNGQVDPRRLQETAVALINRYATVQGVEPSSKEFNDLQRKIADELVVRQIMTDLTSSEGK